MTTSTKKGLASELISGLLILLFVYTAVSKSLDPKRFTATLSQSPLIGTKAAWVAGILPVVEVGLAGLLFFPLTRKEGFLASGLLLLVFTAYIGYLLLFAAHLPCSCGGVLASLGWKEHLLFNAILVGLTVLGWRAERRRGEGKNKPTPSYSRTKSLLQ